MTRDLTPSASDLWRLVERYGSIYHAATAMGVSRDELNSWLRGGRAIPYEHFDRLLALLSDIKRPE
jgi:hypothetical protein